MRFECKFLDGVGNGRAIEISELHKKIWLLNEDGVRRWTFREPLNFEAVYELCGTAMREEEPHLALYGWVDDEP